MVLLKQFAGKLSNAQYLLPFYYQRFMNLNSLAELALPVVAACAQLNELL